METTLLVWCGQDVSSIPTSLTLARMPTGHKRYRYIICQWLSSAKKIQWCSICMVHGTCMLKSMRRYMCTCKVMLSCVVGASV